jgi:dethiobiotin synthetase
MARMLFITGTDTGVGKTAVAVALLRALARTGWRAAAMKPVASGREPGDALNVDVAALVGAAGVAAPLPEVNPYAFDAPIAPHVAAEEAGRRIELGVIRTAAAALARRADVVVVEGAGGVLVPLDERHDMLDIAAALDATVLLVVGVRLGCINHALLSALAIRARGVPLAGWVATRVDPSMSRADASVAAIAARIGAPLLADLAQAASPWPDGALATLGFPPCTRTAPPL